MQKGGEFWFNQRSSLDAPMQPSPSHAEGLMNGLGGGDPGQFNGQFNGGNRQYNGGNGGRDNNNNVNMFNGGNGGGEHMGRPAWGSHEGKAVALRLPPLEEPIHRGFALPEPSPQPQRLEPLHLAGAMAAAQMAQASSNRTEERLMMLEQRTINAERASGEVGRAFDIQNQRVQALTADLVRGEERLMMLEQRTISAERASGEVGRAFDIQNQRLQALTADLSRGTAEVNDLRLRYEHSVAANGALQQQVTAFASELRNYDQRLQGTSLQLQEALRINSDMRSNMARMNDDLGRAAQERAFTTAAVERLGHALSVSTAAVAEDSRRALEEANAAYRLEAGRRQEQHLMELAALNRDVEMFRQEAAGAGAALHTNIERLNARLHSEEAQLDRLRNDAAQTASSEAAQLGGLRAQIGELQTVLNGMSQQLMAEQGARRQDAAAFDQNLRSMEAAMLQAQDTIVKRSVEMLDSRARQLTRLYEELDAKAADLNEETRTQGQQELIAFVKGSAKKERAGLERILVMESALRDVAAAAQMSLDVLNERINTGMTELAVLQETTRRSGDEREAALRDEINTALQKIRAYARDMEESLEQERIKLEEVVKMEIKARMSATENMKELINEASGKAGQTIEDLQAAQQIMKHMTNDLKDQTQSLRRDVDKVQDEVTVKVVKAMSQVEADMAAVRTGQAEVRADMDAEAAKRRQGQDALRAHVDATAAATKTALDTEVQALGAKLRKQAEAEQAAHQELQELIETHSEVFVDVQSKLESQNQKVRTVAAQVSEIYEEYLDKVAELDGRDETLTQELATARTELNDMFTAKLTEQDAKIEQHQTVLEEVMAQVQEQLETKLDALRKDLEHHERLMEKEIRRLEELTEDQAAKAMAAVEAAKLEVAAAIADAVVSLTVDMEAVKTDCETRLAATSAELKTATASVRSECTSGLAAISAALAQEKAATDAALAAAAASLADVKLSTSASIDALTESLTQFVAEAEERHDKMVDKVDKDMAAHKGRLESQLAAVQQAVADQTAELQATRADLNAQRDNTEAALDEMAQHRAGVDKAVASAVASLVDLKAATDAALDEAAVAAEGHRAAADKAVAAAVATMTVHQGTIAELETSVDDLAALLEGQKAANEKRGSETQASVAALTDSVTQFVAEAEERQGRMEAQLAELKATCAKVSSHVDEEKAVTEAGFVAAIEAQAEFKVTTRDALAEAEARHQELAKQVEEARAAAEECAGLLDEFAQLKVDNEVALEALRKDLAAQTAELEPLREKAKELYQRVDEATSRVEELNDAMQVAEAGAEGQLRELEEQLREEIAQAVEAAPQAKEAAAAPSTESIQAMIDEKLADKLAELREELAHASEASTKAGADVPSNESIQAIIDAKLAELQEDVSRTMEEQMHKEQEGIRQQIEDHLASSAALQKVQAEVEQKAEQMIKDSSSDTIQQVSDVTSTLIDEQIKKFKLDINQEIDQRFKQQRNRQDSGHSAEDY